MEEKGRRRGPKREPEKTEAEEEETRQTALLCPLPASRFLPFFLFSLRLPSSFLRVESSFPPSASSSPVLPPTMLSHSSGNAPEFLRLADVSGSEVCPWGYLNCHGR